MASVSTTDVSGRELITFLLALSLLVLLWALHSSLPLPALAKRRGQGADGRSEGGKRSSKRVMTAEGFTKVQVVGGAYMGRFEAGRPWVEQPPHRRAAREAARTAAARAGCGGVCRGVAAQGPFY